MSVQIETVETKPGISRRHAPLALAIYFFGLERFLNGHTDPRLPLGRSLDIDFRFGSHLLKPEMINPQTRLVIGEVGLPLLERFRKINELGEEEFLKLYPPDQGLSQIAAVASETLLHSTTRVTPLDLRKEIQALILAKQQGVHFVSTDTHHSITVRYANIHKYYSELDKPGRLKTSLLLSTIVATLPLLFPHIRPKIIKDNLLGAIYKKTIIPGDLLALVTAVTVTERSTAVNILEEVGLQEEEANTLYDYIEALGNPYLQVFHRLSRIRDIGMVLNTRYIEALLNKMPGFSYRLLENTEDGAGANVLFFAGGGHKNIKNKFRDSSWNLEQELMRHSDYLLNFCIKRLIEEYSDLNDIDQARVVEVFHNIVLVFSPFSIPVPDFTDEPEFQSANRRNLPDCPRTLLYRLIKSKIDHLLPDKKSLRTLPPDKQREITFLRTIYELLHQEDIGFYYSLIPEVSSMRKRAETLVNQSEKLGLHFGNLYSELLIIDGVPYIIAPWLDQPLKSINQSLGSIASNIKAELYSL